MVTQQPASSGSESRLYRGWLLFVLLLVCLVNYADRSVISSVAEPLRREFGLSDLQLGLLQGLSFAVLYSLLGVPFARLAERRSRVRIIAAATFVWSAFTVICGSAANYLQMLLVRVGVGVGEAGFMAPASSLLGDHFPRGRRAFATSIMMLGVPLGALIGATAGGFIAQSMGWRWAFVLMGIPGVVVAALVLFTLREPPRGRHEPVTETEVPSLGAVARQCAADPVFRHVAMGGMLAGFGLHGLGQFLGVYLVRSYGLPLGMAGLLYGLISGGTIAAGLLVGGALADRLGQLDLRWYARIPAIGTALSAPLYLLAFSSTQLFNTILLLLAAGTCLLLHYGPGMAIVQNLATARSRASMIAIYQLVVNVVSMGAGAALIGFFSDRFAAQALTQAGVTAAQAQAIGLRHALMASTVFYVWSGLHYWLAARHQSRA